MKIKRRGYLAPSLTCILSASAVLLAGCEAPRPNDGITVEGIGRVSVAPDAFRVDISVTSNGTDRSSALQTVSTTAQNLVDTLPALEGLEWLEVHREDASITPIYDSPECRRTYGRPSHCQPSGVSASLVLTVAGGPPETAGNVVSLASELGATTSEVSGFYVSDRDRHKAEARQAAIIDAHDQAETLAAALNHRLGRVLSVQAGSPPYEDQVRVMLDMDAPSGLNIGELRRPEVDLQLDPDLRHYQEKVSVRFELISDEAAR